MISMTELLTFSKQILDSYEGAKEPLTNVQEYCYENLKNVRHKAVRQYIKNTDYYDEELLSTCQQFALEKVFVHFTALLLVARCKMDQNFKIDLTEYVN